MLGISSILPAAPVLAADDPQPQSLQLSVSPVSLTATVSPGSVSTYDLRVRNDGQQDEVLKLSLMRFGAFGEEGKPKLTDFFSGDIWKDWMTFSQPEFTARPGEWNTIRATITVPESAALDYNYAITFQRAAQETSSGGQKNDLRGAVATLLILEVAHPSAKRELQLIDFSTGSPLLEFLPASFSIRVRNTGNVHAAPYGNIFIRRGDTEVGIIDVNKDRGNILPDSNRVFTSSWNDATPRYEKMVKSGATVLTNEGVAEQVLRWEGFQPDKLRFGRYTATLSLVYDDGTRDVPLEKTISFWVIPWRVIGYALAVPILPALLVFIVMRRRRRATHV